MNTTNIKSQKVKCPHCGYIAYGYTKTVTPGTTTGAAICAYCKKKYKYTIKVQVKCETEKVICFHESTYLDGQYRKCTKCSYEEFVGDPLPF